jgi:hypothetical protein
MAARKRAKSRARVERTGIARIACSTRALVRAMGERGGPGGLAVEHGGAGRAHGRGVAAESADLDQRNPVAPATLLDERDPATKDYTYRGKVDLIYIDPPFMVTSDFRADDTIDVEIDDEEDR